MKNLSVLLDPFKECWKISRKSRRVLLDRKNRARLRRRTQQTFGIEFKNVLYRGRIPTRALKGDTKTPRCRARWFWKRCWSARAYVRGQSTPVQAVDFSLRNEDGQPIRRDVILHLPEEKHIIIDSKVSMTAYERICLVKTRRPRKVGEGAYGFHQTSCWWSFCKKISYSW